MEYTLKHIRTENDLKQYEGFLKNENSQKTLADFSVYLKKHIGKLVKAELCSNECKTGFLFEVQNGFFVLKNPHNCISTAIPFENTRYITVIHDNDMKKTGAKIR